MVTNTPSIVCDFCSESIVHSFFASGISFRSEALINSVECYLAALVASVSHIPQSQRRNEPKTRQVDLGNGKSQRCKRKQDAADTEAGESSVLDRILRSLNDVKSEVETFRKLLLDYGLMPEDPTPSTKYAAAGKDNGQEPKPRFQRQLKCAAAATKGKPKDKTSRSAQPLVPVTVRQ